jgi:hypothetical protein
MSRTRTDRSGINRLAYVATTTLLAVAGGAAAVAGGAAPGQVAAGLALAVAVQAASFWPLATALESGRPATIAWVAGMAARFGGLMLLWALSALAGLGREVVLAYAFALVTFLMLEAAWLALTTRAGPPDITDR